MNLSMRWLKEFVDIQMDTHEFAEAMTMSGSKVEEFWTEGAAIQNVVVGKVEQLERHPDSDHLWVCQINVGDPQLLQIVTGAQNLTVGDLVPVALNGSVLADGTKIKKGKLRGVESNGMLCSLGELGLTQHDFPYAIEDGIFVLQEPCELGQDIRQAIGYNDTVVDFEITPNRPDCLSVIGLAREAAVTFGKELKLHKPLAQAGHGDCTSMLDVKIEATDLCPIYSARIVKNVRIKPSPRWMRERLRAMGVRPINNIVDITNYVMLEYGQPMHAFDLRYIEDGKIRVRRAHAGETITTLDGVARTLKENQLVIADAKKPVAIAGVMGGEYSGIMDDTTTIVFESANFLGSSVRVTARDQGMRTDASSRYEKGLDPNNCLPALERACELVEILDAGDVMDGVLMDDHRTSQETRIPLDAGWINRFLAVDLPVSEMQRILQQLGCEIQGDEVIVPSFRSDLEHKADLAEEIARFYGYNRVASTAVQGSMQGKYSPRQKLERTIRETMLALGLSEIMTYSFISPKYYDKIGMPEEHPLRKSVVISNPLGEDTSIMRTTALPSMMEILARNFNNRNAQAHLFELAKEYLPGEDEDALPQEPLKLIGGLYGDDVDFFVAKGIVESLLEKLSIDNYDVEAAADAFGYHPGRCARLTVNGEEIGLVGEMHPAVCANYGMACRVYTFTLSVDALFRYANDNKQYHPLPKFPAVTRDLALICDDETPVLTLEKAIAGAAGKHLEKIELFDVYKGKQIADGKKSVAFSIRLRSADGTLTEEQVGSILKKTMQALEKLGATLRT